MPSRRLAVLVLAFVVGGCKAAVSKPSDTSCTASDECDDGYACVESVCVQLCNTDADCWDSDHDCIAGLCQVPPENTCEIDHQCLSPNQCQLGEGARCVSGVCSYAPLSSGSDCDDRDPCTLLDACDGSGACVGAPKQCTEPPDNECTEVDTVFVTYPAIGRCEGADAECVYRPTSQPCPNCSVNCRHVCDGVVCDDTGGGCRIDGTCTAGDLGPECTYQPAPDLEPCERDTPGVTDGYCLTGACVECTQPTHCQEPPGDHECFAAVCETNGCVYHPQSTVVCEEETCTDGFLFATRLCGTDGSCPLLEPPGTSCGGFACNAGGDACLDSCDTAAQCAGGLNCLSDHTCEVPKTIGESCSEHGECLSGACVDERCCNSMCTGVCRRCDSVDGTAGQCHLVAAGNDPDDECPITMGDCGTDSCSGTEPRCEYRDLNTACGVCRRCDSAGACVTNSSSHVDCEECEKCASGRCVDQAGDEDLKVECTADAACGTSTCNGVGACNFASANSQPPGCAGCRECDGLGTCANIADTTPCGDHGLACFAGECECPGGSPEVSCANNIDDDCDGDADCLDPDCVTLFCDDDDLCNGSDTCGADRACSIHDGDPCAIYLGNDNDDCSEACDPATGECTADDADGSFCNDNDLCTGVDSCDAGSCSQHTGVIDCGGPTHGTCDTGVCSCNPGYQGDDCELCAAGYAAVGPDCVSFPLSLSPFAWYRADLGVTDTASRVEIWADQSGNGHDVDQSEATQRPVLDGSGARDAVSFDATNAEHLDTNTAERIPSPARTHWVIARIDAVDGTNWGIMTQWSKTALEFQHDGTGIIRSRVAPASLLGTSPANDTMLALVTTHDADVSTAVYYRNNIAVDSAVDASNALNSIYMFACGARDDGTFPITGAIFEWGYVGRELDPTERAALHAYFVEWYGDVF